MINKRLLFAELLGTMFLIMLGCGVVAMTVVFADPASVNGFQVVNGGYTNIVFGWGLGVVFGVMVALRISGAHINPAVTIAMASTGRMQWSLVPTYIIGQCLGAFIGATIVFVVFFAKWLQFDPMLDHTAGVFATFPAVPYLWWPGIVDQVVGTFILVFLVLTLGNYIKKPTESLLMPFAVGAIVLAIGISFGGMHGYAINPARDLMPRLFALLVGFKNTGFETLSIWTVPVVCPILGGILGAKVFDLTIKEAQ